MVKQAAPRNVRTRMVVIIVPARMDTWTLIGTHVTTLMSAPVDIITAQTHVLIRVVASDVIVLKDLSYNRITCHVVTLMNVVHKVISAAIFVTIQLEVTYVFVQLI